MHYWPNEAQPVNCPPGGKRNGLYEFPPAANTLRESLDMQID